MKKLILIILCPFLLNAQSSILTLFDSGVDYGVTLKDSLKAWWNLSDANDSYSTNNLTNSGVAFSLGKIGNAGVFSGAENDQIYIANNASLNVSGSVDFTIAAWVNVGAEANMGVFTKSGASSTIEYYLYYNNSLVPADFQFYVSADGSATTSTYSTAGSATSAWHLVICWREGNNIYLQINNGTVFSQSFSSNLYAGTSNFSIGRRYTGATTVDFTGSVDEVGYWKRALISGERAYLYNSGNGRTYSGGKIQ